MAQENGNTTYTIKKILYAGLMDVKVHMTQEKRKTVTWDDVTAYLLNLAASNGVTINAECVKYVFESLSN